MEHNIYMDEKGPQEHIRRVKSNLGFYTNKPAQRFSIGDDTMLDYVIVAVDIPTKNLDLFEHAFKKVEKNYIKTVSRKGELKGAYLLRKKFLDSGLATLPHRETEYYLAVLELFEKYNIKTCIITENKVASILNGRLEDWVLNASSTMNVSPQLVDYTLIKYMTFEASEGVLDCFFDYKKSIYQILSSIKRDMKYIISKNESNKRMNEQLKSYKQVIKILNKCSNMQACDPKSSGDFEWKKIAYSLSLWFDERSILKRSEEYNLYLDEGIEKKNVNNSQYKNIYSDQNSINVVGLRCADLVATITGKLLSKLNTSTLYDVSMPDKRVLLSEDWFELNNNQLQLAKKLYKLMVNNGAGQFSFITGTYFDGGVNLISYLEYLSNFSNVSALKENATAEDEFELTYMNALSRWKKMNQILLNLNDIDESAKDAIEMGILKPL